MKCGINSCFGSHCLSVCPFVGRSVCLRLGFPCAALLLHCIFRSPGISLAPFYVERSTSRGELSRWCLYAVARRINFKIFNSCHELWADDMRLESFHCQLLLLLLLCCLFVFHISSRSVPPRPWFDLMLSCMLQVTFLMPVRGWEVERMYSSVSERRRRVVIAGGGGGGAGDEKSVIFKLWNAI